MSIAGVIGSLILIFLILIDGFETILQPRRVTHRFRFARLFYRSTWQCWRAIALQIPTGKKREAFLGVFGPLSLLGLFSMWIVGLIIGFASLHNSLDTLVHGPDPDTTFGTYLYLSGTTFFTLGLGDVTPLGALGRTFTVIESGLGFGFLAVMISYLPVLYQAFSEREVIISLMDARAGSPPSAGEFFLRIGKAGHCSGVDSLLVEWERWAAKLLESHLSFPVLSYYRSQHDNQSWLAALACILDICAILMVELKSDNSYQAQLTFAMARHAAVDLALVLKAPPPDSIPDRLPEDQRRKMEQAFREIELDLHDGGNIQAKLAQLRGMYEPFIHALSRRFLLTIPPILSSETKVDNWQTSAWMVRTPGIGSLPGAPGGDGHFD